MTTVLSDLTPAAHHLTPPEGPMFVAVREPMADRSAVDWAARRAESREVPLTLLHAVPDPSLIPPGTAYGEVVGAGRELVNREAARVSLEHPGLRLATYLYCGDVVEALLGLSTAAPMIVVGADRKDSRTGEFKDSVALQVALNSSAPVVVVPPSHAYRPANDQDKGGVVVGIDGSSMSHVALIRGAEEASSAATHLTAVAASGPLTERMEVTSSTMLLDVRARYPHMRVSWIVDDAHSPVQLLDAYGRSSDLLVIGRHGTGARSAMSLGRVTRTLLLDPPCPTLIVTRRQPESPVGTAARRGVIPASVK
jgi:nucleotide-binding universal stress UspA family protein